MSGSVTPARRRRDDSDEEEEDFEVSVDGESPAHSNRSKRVRLSDNDRAGLEDGDDILGLEGEEGEDDDSEGDEEEPEVWPAHTHAAAGH